MKITKSIATLLVIVAFSTAWAKHGATLHAAALPLLQAGA